jgi:hypothetical protein
MFGYIASKARIMRDRLLGVWQHAGSRSPSRAAAPRAEAQIGTERGRTVIQLTGRDIPTKPDRIWEDCSGELELKGFLDHFPQNPLLLEDCKPPDEAKAKKPQRNKTKSRTGKTQTNSKPKAEGA